MKRGITFKIPNGHGRILGEILKPFDVAAFHWYNGGEEAYFSGMSEPLFPEQTFGMDGILLKESIENHDYYVIFADLKAYPKNKKVIDVRTYEEYLTSDCQFVLLVVDCTYITIYCKDKDKLEDLYHNAILQGFNDVEYTTDENDYRTGLSVW
ncbi:DUF2691 family protein [Paenibacillus ihuae]|uniref:DUF2691 family protein n=1 Tax=Paenibacillus ihuae TaxID=1232431 RepID=UPI0006D55704|nr:DUF2691 family protein [Paenibacillus ihuae]